MDPISAGLGILGLGLSIFGGAKSSSDSKQLYQIQSQETGLEQDVNSQRQQAMVLSAQRQQLQNIRNTQLARSMALNSATGQGAQFGSGLQGGYGQISGQSGVNGLGVSQNLEIGQNIFGLDSQISGLKQQASGVQSNIATDQAISSLGGSISKAGPMVGALSQSFGGMFNSKPSGNLGGLY